MNRLFGFAVAAAIVTAATMAAGDGFYSSSSSHPVYQDDSNPNATWSGSKEDLDAIIAQAKANYGFEDSKHLGRNATMLVPASLSEMNREITKHGNKTGWDPKFWDGWHAADAKNDDGWITAGKNSLGSGVKKYVNDFGDEVVYDKKTGRIVKDSRMGTKNFSALHDGTHSKLDVIPHQINDNYKYAGILYERDLKDPNKFYLVDGQTGKRMTRRQAEEFPTTLSDMWRDQGLICVADDATDIVPPEQPKRDAAATAPRPDATQSTRAPSSSDPAAQANIVDNTAMKKQMSAMLEGAYQYASGIAAEGGVGAEYQSAVAPVMSQGRAAINAIPDRQTIMVPAGQSPKQP